MLAQNFKTAAELGISDADYDALHNVRGMLERGELVHAPDTEAFEGQNGFNMDDYDNHEYSSPIGCGTVCCIAGWCDRLFKTRLCNLHASEEIPQALSDLFSGWGSNTNIMASQGAIAIRNYLTHGEPRWAEVMAP